MQKADVCCLFVMYVGSQKKQQQSGDKAEYWQSCSTNFETSWLFLVDIGLICCHY